MQDNNWTDDKGFYDEAWTDMAAKLDAANQPRRRGLGRWWAPLILLLLVAGLMVYTTNQPGEETAEESARLRPAASSSVAESEAKRRSESPNEVELNTAPSQTSSAAQQRMADAHFQRKTGSEGVRDGQLTRTRSAFAQVLESNLSEGRVPTEVNSQVAKKGPPFTTPSPNPIPSVDAPIPSGATQATPSASELDIQNDGRQASMVGTRVTQSAISPIASLPTEVNELFRPTPSALAPFKGRKTSGNFFVEGFGTSSTDLDNVGFAVGAGYRLNVGRRLSIPLSASYRVDRDAITGLDFDYNPVVDLAGVPPAVTSDELSRGVLDDLELTELNVIRSAGIELNAGLGYRLSRRLSAGVRMGVLYRLSTAGPRLSDSDGNVVLDLRYDGVGLGTLFSNRLENLNTGFNPTTGDLDAIENPEVNRWALTTGVELNYHFTRKVSAGVNLRYVGEALTNGGTVQTATTRVGVGLRYSF